VPDLIDVAPLAAHPENLSKLATWLENAWPAWYGPGGSGIAIDDLRARCRRNGLPYALVALCDGELCGTAALTPVSVPSHAHRGPWLSGLLVASEFRRRGIAERLIEGIEVVARQQGYKQIYAAAGNGPVTPRTSLRRRGWSVFDGAGSGLTVYSKAL